MSALNQQVQESKIYKDVEKQRNEAFGETNWFLMLSVNMWTWTNVTLSLSIVFVASEMKRNDMISQLLQQRQEKDIAQLNKVCPTPTLASTNLLHKSTFSV